LINGHFHRQVLWLNIFEIACASAGSRRSFISK